MSLRVVPIVCLPFFRYGICESTAERSGSRRSNGSVLVREDAAPYVRCTVAVVPCVRGRRRKEDDDAAAGGGLRWEGWHERCTRTSLRYIHSLRGPAALFTCSLTSAQACVVSEETSLVLLGSDLRLLGPDSCLVSTSLCFCCLFLHHLFCLSLFSAVE